MNQRKSEALEINGNVLKNHTEKKEEFKDIDKKKQSMTSSQLMNDKKVFFSQ